ncbi:glycosyltransferase [uncultured Pseudoalteromonas sp.]|uniref:glycosyltransferase n=1 Tax=uncultured Pseudoalteromonas sp. TaxID=114053 RepID=UPI0025946E92|nr:glycosyltransferase [uncultured Pseudoalteromonas sp.]
MFDLKAFREQSLPTQAQIISQWEGNLTSPLVSVICTAYNQESYIEDALKGFLMQKTDFPFEIIIHDDASTDKTADIINGYAKKYPLIIKPILQKNNQYSINGHLPLLNTKAVASGEYLAICEGDDFWIDENKLQKQAELLVNSKNINICISKAISLFPDGTTKSFCDLGNDIKIIPFEKCIIGPKKDFFPTGSFFLKREAFNLLPDWFEIEAPVGDYYIQLISAKYNGVLYLPDTLSVYRRDAIGSWSKRNNNNRILIDLKKRVNCIHLLYPTIDFKYRKTLRLKIAIYQSICLRIHMRNRDYFESFKLIISLLKNIDVITNYIITNKIM